MLSLLKRTLQLLPGLLLIAVVIWVAGPYVAISGTHPLESEAARLTAIAFVVGAWLAWVLFERWRAARASGQLAAAVLAQSHAEPAAPADVVKLREGFEQAVSTLGKGTRGSLYDLPWYVFIGPPGSGKTTALLNSGLNFSLDQSGGQARVRGIGGTRNCDWWFTDEAVFLDTAGRFTTQDSDAASDSAGWKEFLALLRKYRTRRPINGVILTVSAKDLLTQGDVVRDQQIEAARYRLRELGRELQIQLPVYVMVTMCDLVAGFTEYFEDLPQEGRAQVWGVTFPYEQTQAGKAARAFPAEFDALVTRLNERLFARLDQESDSRRRARIFAFPQQIAALRDALAQVVAEVFSSAIHDQHILLRGVYFTSGTQEGTPIDRLLGAMGRGFRLAPDVVAAPTGRGKAYFVERLLKQVLIGESGLAGVNRRLETKKAAAQLAVYAALVVAAVFGVTTLSVSYRRNAAFLTDVGNDVARLRDVPPAGPNPSAQSLLTRLDAVRAVVDSANRYNDDVPLGMRWGLFQGRSIGNAARDAYRLELDSSLLPFVASRIQRRLLQHGREPEKLYEYLKAYQMLAKPEHLNKKHLLDIARLEWNRASGVSEEDGASLTRHLQTLLDSAAELRPVATDARLVAQACDAVRQVSLGRIMYTWLRDTYATDTSQVVRLDVAAGQVITRRSGISLSQPVPSLFTRPAFEKITGGDLPELVTLFAKDNWVCERGRDLGDRRQLERELTNIYQQEYIATWQEILDDLVLESPTTVEGMAELLGVLSGPTSPLKMLLQVVAENTRLVTPSKPSAEQASTAPGGVLATGKAYADRVASMLSRGDDAGPAPPPAATPGALVTARFQAIHRLVEGEPGNTPIDKILNRLRELEQQLRALGPQVGGKPVADALRDPQLKSIFGLLDRETEAMPSPVREIVARIGTGVERTVSRVASEEVVSSYRLQVLAECGRFVTGRYPFTPGSRTDIPLTEFARLFGPNGVFDQFFAKHLADMVDTSTQPWSWRPGSVAPYQGMLAFFQEARVIRDAFFTGGAAPELRFNVSITHVDAAATRFVLDIDGQAFEDRRGGRAPGTWPGQNGGSASAAFEDRTGIRSGTAFEGPWAWFRLIDNSQPQRVSELQTTLTFRGQREHEAQVTIEASSAANPFARREWRRFGCGS
jgi:type VI secretion system protein ImpL